MSNETTPPEENSKEFTDLLAGLAKRPDGSMVAERYRIEKHLGGGGMGDVYLVKDTELKDEYRALKLIKGQFVSNETDLKRFQNEVRLTSRLDHPNIVRVFEYGVDGGELYYTMQYVKGKSLRELLDDHDNKLPLDQALKILTELAKALEHAHAQKVIHRDLKPENIIIPDDGSPIKLTDFGLARSVEDDEERLTKLDSALGGTANYMSPEQAAESTDIDHRSDIYSFGILAYELATGKVPFEGLPGIVKHHHRETPIPSAKKQNRKLPGWIASIIEACTKKDREERYQSFEEIARVLGKQSYSFHWRSTKSKFVAASVALITAIIATYLNVKMPGLSGSGEWGESYNMEMLDFLFQVRGELPPPEDVTLVAMDDLSRGIFNKVDSRVSDTTAWPRLYYANVINEIAKDKPKKIIVDINFHHAREPVEEDDLLVEAISKAPTYIARAPTLIDGIVVEKEPQEKFRDVAAGVFNANGKTDDGIVRQFPFTPLYDEKVFIPSIAVTLTKKERSSLEMPEFEDYINFYGGADHFDIHSMYKVVMRGEYAYSDKLQKSAKILVGEQSLKSIPAGYFKDKYVVLYERTHLGYSGKSRDVFPTAYRKKLTPGGEIHATNLSNVLRGDYIKSVPANIQMFGVLLFAFLVSFEIVLMTAVQGLVLIVASILAWILLAVAGFSQEYFIAGAGTIWILSLVYILRSVFRYARLQLEKQS